VIENEAYYLSKVEISVFSLACYAVTW